MINRYTFRGKWVDNGEWVLGGLVECELYGSETGYFIQAPQPFNMEPPCHKVDPATLGQCTGLRDKNGRLIFEGDIVQLKNNLAGYMDNDYEYAKIVWKDIYAAWVIRSGEWRDDELFADFCREYEVIGNIHDNPELMAGER